ncbi:MAG TPA: glucose 1-dehydrogenase [Gryllotalpicola sp.]
MTEREEPGRGMLRGKSVVITGASTGIGADAARLFAAEGAAVMLGARSGEPLAALAEELAAGGAQVGWRAVDISTADGATRLINGAVDEFGRLDGAFNNAGTTHYGKLIEVSEEEFDRVMAVNVKGVWLSMRAEFHAMVATSEAGSIVNTTSVAGYRGSAGIGVYPASKHAVIGMTKVMARDSGPSGIRVNTVAPGTTETPIIADWRERDPEAVLARVAQIPMGRPNTALEVARAAAWLLSDLSQPITGAVLPVDGGSSA